MNHTASLSVVIAAKNCADRITDTITPWLWAKEVIVADQNSTDETAAIAEKLGARIFRSTSPVNNFDLNRKYAMQSAVGDWIIYIDTDERPSDRLIAEIKSFLEQPPSNDVTGVRIPNRFIFLGKPLTKGIYNRRHSEIRMVARDKWHYPCEDGYHRGVSVVRGSVVTFQHHYDHFNVNGLSEWFIKTNQYTELDASPDKAATWSALFNFIRFFIKHYFIKQGFMDGWHGFLSCFYFGLYHFTLSAKSWEKAFLRDKRCGEDYLMPFGPQSR
jgi:glycosyltransferase involved in cell wall biosynthesis